MIQPKELILFDLDGTMVDTVPDLTHAIDTMQAELGLPAHGEDKVRAWIGKGMDRLVKRALTDSSDGEPDPVLYERGRTIFMDAYAARPCEQSCFYPGVEKFLDHLGSVGYRLGCITNKRGRFTDKLLQQMGIHHHFAIVLSGDTLPRRKPDPLPLLHAGEQLGVSPDRMLMIGDSLNDVQAARTAGVDVVCVSYGYNEGRDIREAKPDRVVDSLTELVDFLPGTMAA